MTCFKDKHVQMRKCADMQINICFLQIFWSL